MDDLIDKPPTHHWTLMPGHILVPIRVWSSAEWDSALATGAVAHMRSDDRARYAQLYSLVAGINSILGNEFTSVSELHLIERGGPLSQASEDRLRADVARIRGYNTVVALASGELSRQMRAAGIVLSAEDERQLKAEVCAMPRDNLDESAARRNGH
jgi:hypothetical protein